MRHDALRHPVYPKASDERQPAPGGGQAKAPTDSLRDAHRRKEGSDVTLDNAKTISRICSQIPHFPSVQQDRVTSLFDCNHRNSHM